MFRAIPGEVRRGGGVRGRCGGAEGEVRQGAWLRCDGDGGEEGGGVRGRGERVGSPGLSLREGESCITGFIEFLSEFY